MGDGERESGQMMMVEALGDTDGELMTVETVEVRELMSVETVEACDILM
jgi:hypothetical protein